MNRSEQINELAAALSKFQGAVGSAKKSGKNPHFKTKYASLEDVYEAIREPLAAAGLSVTQLPFDESGPDTGDMVGVETVLMHSSGQWISSRLALPTVSNKGTLPAQAAGICISYARRYCLMAVLGIPAEDDDGEGQRGGQRQARRDNVDEGLRKDRAQARKTPLEKGEEKLAAAKEAEDRKAAFEALKVAREALGLTPEHVQQVHQTLYGGPMKKDAVIPNIARVTQVLGAMSKEDATELMEGDVGTVVGRVVDALGEVSPESDGVVDGAKAWGLDGDSDG